MVLKGLKKMQFNLDLLSVEHESVKSELMCFHEHSHALILTLMVKKLVAVKLKFEKNGTFSNRLSCFQSDFHRTG